MKVHEVAGITVLDDAYNANPASVAAALQTLASLPTAGRRIAALGDMLELGPTADTLHAEAGARAAELGLDLLVGAGPLMSHAVGAARAAGIRAEAVLDSKGAGDVLLAQLQPGDLLLLKGSRGMKMEAALEPLAALSGGN
jgi:UDP-N-acetylmuramyl pentapeptide synthase